MFLKNDSSVGGNQSTKPKVILLNSIEMDGAGDWSHFEDIYCALHPKFQSYFLIPVVCVKKESLFPKIKQRLQQLAIGYYYLGNYAYFSDDLYKDKQFQKDLGEAIQVIAISSKEFIFNEHYEKLCSARVPFKFIGEHEKIEPGGLKRWLHRSMGLGVGKYGIKLLQKPTLPSLSAFAAIEQNAHDFVSELLKRTASSDFQVFSQKHFLIPAYFNKWNDFKRFVMIFAVNNKLPKQKNIVITLTHQGDIQPKYDWDLSGTDIKQIEIIGRDKIQEYDLFLLDWFSGDNLAEILTTIEQVPTRYNNNFVIALPGEMQPYNPLNIRLFYITVTGTPEEIALTHSLKRNLLRKMQINANAFSEKIHLTSKEADELIFSKIEKTTENDERRIKIAGNPNGERIIYIFMDFYINNNEAYDALYQCALMVGVSGDNTLEKAITNKKLPYYFSTNNTPKGATLGAIKKIIAKECFAIKEEVKQQLLTFFDDEFLKECNRCSFQAEYADFFSKDGSAKEEVPKEYKQLDLLAMTQAWPLIASYLIEHHNFYNRLEEIFFENLDLNPTTNFSQGSDHNISFFQVEGRDAEVSRTNSETYSIFTQEIGLSRT